MNDTKNEPVIEFAKNFIIGKMRTAMSENT